ncbi:Uncharacterized protein FWK35_00038672 [Aphis craccivora]|uniref:Uncharacterized protein n=1 Tax=Aphis craccivora TaxID=307492 RepID=A0A6G0VGR1_APHCR|nr:Uncharacterized protein FWK35_00038672 [Aphis craccivora]
MTAPFNMLSIKSPPIIKFMTKGPFPLLRNGSGPESVRVQKKFYPIRFKYEYSYLSGPGTERASGPAPG